MGLYDDILPTIQETTTYGGGASVFLLQREVFNAIDEGATNKDGTLFELKAELSRRAAKWKNPQDYEALRHVVEIYCEATFYLSSTRKGLSLEAIPQIKGKKTPDFTTLKSPQIHFEIKALDIVNPIAEYEQQMCDGLEANINAHEIAKKQGIGFSEQVVNPHGNAKTWLKVMHQTMAKLAGNIKKEQYANAPTFLVANMGRLSIRVDAENLALCRPVPAVETFENKDADVTGQLWAIANHKAGNSFSWQDVDARIMKGKLEREGLLRDFNFLQGIIFTTEPWNEFDQQNDWRDLYPFLGVWNSNCSLDFSKKQQKEARSIFELLCTDFVESE